MKCPNCGDDKYRLSHRRNRLEKALSLLGVRPVRCLSCDERRFVFLLFRGPVSQKKPSPPGKQ